jgi:hypothetical protein
LVLGLNSFVSTATKAEILLLLSLITVSSQRGRWLILESLNNYKIFHRETVRFEKLGYSMHMACALDEQKRLKRDNSDYLTTGLMFINALMNKGDFTTRVTLRKEINLAKVFRFFHFSNHSRFQLLLNKFKNYSILHQIYVFKWKVLMQRWKLISNNVLQKILMN